MYISISLSLSVSISGCTSTRSWDIPPWLMANSDYAKLRRHKLGRYTVTAPPDLQ